MYIKYNNRFTALSLGLLRWASTRRKIHPLIIMLIINQPLSASSIHYDSLFNLRAWQSICTAYLQVLFDLPLGLQTGLQTST